MQLIPRSLRELLPALVLGGGLLLAPSMALSQGITTGTVSGTVTDSTGSVVPGAHIIVKNLETGVVLKHDSQSNGAFDFAALPTGNYSVTIDASGFAEKIVSPVLVNVGHADLGQLQLGLASSSSTVQVTEAAPLLDTTQSMVSDTFSAKQLQNLPTDGGFDVVALLEPGVVQTHDAAFSDSNGASFSSNGSRGRSNNFEIDGQSNNDNSVAGPQMYFGNQDALSGIQVITNSFSAEYGRNMGSVVNYLTRSGTNNFHGALFEYNEGNWGESFDQASKSDFSYFGFCSTKVTADCTAPTLTRYVENKFGGVLTGPILRDRLWFMGAANFDRTHYGGGLSRSNNALTPTTNGLSQLATLYPGNAAVQALASNGPFAVTGGNPIAYNVQDISVTGPDGNAHAVEFGSVERSVAEQSNDEELLGRLDWQPTAKDHVFLRYFYQDDPFINATGTSSTTALGRWYNEPDTGHSVGADITHSFSPTWTNQLRYSFQQTKLFFQGGSTPDCTVTNPGACPTPVSISGNLAAGYTSAAFGTDGSSLPQGRTVKVTQIQDNANWTKGRHNITFGGEFDYQNSPNPFLPYYVGSASFGSFSNFLASDGTYSLANGNFTIHFTEPDAAAYFQDDIKVSQNLTLNLGLRWEFFGQSVNLLHDETVARESNPATAIWDSSLPLSERTFPSIAQNYKNFQPRLGFAWNPDALNHRAVVRGAFAINYDPEFYNMFLNAASSAPVVLLSTGNECNGTCLNSGATGTGFRTQNLPSVSGTSANPGAYAETNVLPNFQNPYTETWNLGVQFSPVNAVMVDLRYVGNHAVKLFQSLDGNPDVYSALTDFSNTGASASAMCSDDTAVGYERPSCNTTNVRTRANTAASNYNAFQFEAKTQSYKGLTASFSYTYAHTFDNASEVYGTLGGGNTNAFAQNPFNTSQAEYAHSGIDVPNVTSASFVYEEPFFHEQHGIKGEALGGWTLSGIYTYDSGNTSTPYNYDYGYYYTGAGENYNNYCDAGFANAFNSGYSVCRPYVSNAKAPMTSVAILDTDGRYYALQDYLNNGNATSGGTPVNASNYHWLYANQSEAKLHGCAFCATVGRNTLRATAWNNLNAVLYKNVKIRDPYTLQLSFEARNVLNRQYFGTPDPEIDDVSFWDTRYSSGSSRYVRIGARMTF